MLLQARIYIIFAKDKTLLKKTVETANDALAHVKKLMEIKEFLDEGMATKFEVTAAADFHSSRVHPHMTLQVKSSQSGY